MDKLKYLKIAINSKQHLTKSWVIKLFAITKPKPIDILYDLAREPWGYSTLTDVGVEKIDDTNPETSLYTPSTIVTIDHTWLPNIPKDTTIETTVGRLLFNATVLVEAFGSKIPYINSRVSIKDIDSKIASIMVDTPTDSLGEIDLTATRDPSVIYVDEYLKYVDALQYISSYSQLVSVAATKKNITKPVGLVEFKAKLLVKYEGKLHLPIELAKFEQELKDFDDEYMKDDPSYGKLVSGKVKDVARKKLYLSVGAEQGFGTSSKVDPILNSLDEGWSGNKDDLVTSHNSTRVGSYSRGTETIKGGVSAKILLRATNNFKIIDTDCDSKLGIKKTYNIHDIGNLVNRYIITPKGPLLIEADVSKYIGKSLQVRSPMYCLLEGEQICKTCAGENLSKFKNGLAIPITEITGSILTASLKKMHGSVLSTETISLDEAMS